MKTLDRNLLEGFVCGKCEYTIGEVEHLAMSGKGITRIIDIQLHEYAFVSCTRCGYTEIYHLQTLKEAE